MVQHPIVFDRALVTTRRRRAAAGGPATFLIERVAEDLAERLSGVRRRFDRVVDLASPTDALSRALAGVSSVGPIVAAVTSPATVTGEGLTMVADEEKLPLREGAIDLIV